MKSIVAKRESGGSSKSNQGMRLRVRIPWYFKRELDLYPYHKK